MACRSARPDRGQARHAQRVAPGGGPGTRVRAQHRGPRAGPPRRHACPDAIRGERGGAAGAPPDDGGRHRAARERPARGGAGARPTAHRNATCGRPRPPSGHGQPHVARCARPGAWRCGARQALSVSLRGPGAEAELDQQRLEVGAHDRLAVDALQARACPRARRGRTRRAPRAPSRSRGSSRARRATCSAAAAPLDVHDRLGAGQHDVGAARRARARRRLALAPRPRQRGAVGLGRVGRGEDERGGAAVAGRAARAAARPRPGSANCAPPEPLDEVAAPADPRASRAPTARRRASRSRRGCPRRAPARA